MFKSSHRMEHMIHLATDCLLAINSKQIITGSYFTTLWFLHTQLFFARQASFLEFVFSSRYLDSELSYFDACIKHTMLCLIIKIWIKIWIYSIKVCFFSAYRQINFIISEKLLRLNNRLMENTNKMSVNSFIQCLKGSIASAVRHVVQMTYFNDSTGFFEKIYIFLNALNAQI